MYIDLGFCKKSKKNKGCSEKSRLSCLKLYWPMWEKSAFNCVSVAKTRNKFTWKFVPLFPLIICKQCYWKHKLNLFFGLSVSTPLNFLFTKPIFQILFGTDRFEREFLVEMRILKENHSELISNMILKEKINIAYFKGMRAC